MILKNLNDFRFTFACIEATARKLKQNPRDIFFNTGIDGVLHLYEYADVSHCLPLEQCVDDLIEDYNLKEGTYDIEKLFVLEYIPSCISIGRSLGYLAMEINSESVGDTFRNIYSSIVFQDICYYNGAMWYTDTEGKLEFMIEDGDIDGNLKPLEKTGELPPIVYKR